MVKHFGAVCFGMPRGKDAKKHSLLRLREFSLFRKIIEILSLFKRNIIISTQLGEKKFLSELHELRNFREGDSCLVQPETVLEPSPAFVMLTGVRKRLLPLTKREGSDSVIISNLTDTNHSQLTTHHSPKRKVAFTLAEVLITLGIIGIVASMTLPNLIQNYQRHVVETRLRKFYSVMSQTVKMAELDYGDMEDWLPYWKLWGQEVIHDESEVSTDMNGNPVKGETLPEKFFNKYFIPYLKGAETQPLDDGTFIVYFSDGTALRQDATHPEKINGWLFYPSNAKRCGLYPQNGIGMNKMACDGKCCFGFSFSILEGRYGNTRAGFEPNKYYWDKGTREQLVSLCKTYRFSCASLIQYDGWHISKDYPQRIKL